MSLSPRFGRHGLPSWQNSWIAILGIGLALLQPNPGKLFGQDKPVDRADVQINANIGLAGQWKLGQTTALSIHLTTDRPISGVLETEVADGDGVRVIYRNSQQLIEVTPDAPVAQWLYPRIGRSDQPILVRFRQVEEGVLDDNSSDVWETQVDGTSLPPPQPWVVVIGDSLGIETLSVQSLASDLPSFSTAVLAKSQDIPTEPNGFAGVDVLIISSGEMALLQSLDQQQQSAISQWVKNGGQVIISFGSQADAVTDLPWLKEMIPAKINGAIERVEPLAIESFVGARNPLDQITVAYLTEVDAEIDLISFASDRRKLPSLMRGTFGLGRTTIVAFDLDSEVMAKWPERAALMQRLLNNRWEAAAKTARSKDSQTTTFLGYDDLSGQLRAALEYFPSVQTASFSQVSAILLVFLLIVGPLDYWLMVRFLKRPEWTWWSLSIATVATSLGLILLQQSWKPVAPQINMASILDIDVATSHARGQAWFHFYSGVAKEYDIQATETSMGTDQSRPVLVDWHGLPGRGLGSMESGVQTDRGMPRYDINLNLVGLDSWPIKGLGVPTAATKSLQTSWSNDVGIPLASSFQEISGADQLEGEFKNDLPYSLMDGYLVYHTWAYPLRTRIRSGDIVSITSDQNPKDLTRRLVRRTIIEGNDVMSPWAASDRENLDRIVELLLFHQAAGGPAYTGLSHRFQAHTDLTELSRLDRAILVARLEEPIVHVKYRDSLDGSETSEESASDASEPMVNRSEAWIRIILPVKQTNRS